jgi:hypothetical protein
MLENIVKRRISKPQLLPSMVGFPAKWPKAAAMQPTKKDAAIAEQRTLHSADDSAYQREARAPAAEIMAAYAPRGECPRQHSFPGRDGEAAKASMASQGMNACVLDLSSLDGIPWPMPPHTKDWLKNSFSNTAPSD